MSTVRATWADFRPSLALARVFTGLLSCDKLGPSCDVIVSFRARRVSGERSSVSSLVSALTFPSLLKAEDVASCVRMVSCKQAHERKKWLKLSLLFLGAQAATKGTKHLQAQSKVLSDQVKLLTKRVRELENALAKSAIAEPVESSETIADIFDKDNLVPLGIDGELAEGLGVLSIRSRGQTYHGQSASSEVSSLSLNLFKAFG